MVILHTQNYIKFVYIFFYCLQVAELMNTHVTMDNVFRSVPDVTPDMTVMTTRMNNYVVSSHLIHLSHSPPLMERCPHHWLLCNSFHSSCLIVCLQHHACFIYAAHTGPKLLQLGLQFCALNKKLYTRLSDDLLHPFL